MDNQHYTRNTSQSTPPQPFPSFSQRYQKFISIRQIVMILQYCVIFRASEDMDRNILNIYGDMDKWAKFEKNE